MAVGIAEAQEGHLTRERISAPRRTLLVALLLGVLADAAIRNAPEGLGWTLWVTALALAAGHVARHRGITLAREQVGWLGVAVACAAAFSWRDAEELRVFNVLGTLVAVSLFAMSASGLPAPSILVARVRDVIAAGAYALRDVVAGAPVLVAREAELQSLPAVRGGASWTALRAILITVPVVLVFAILFTRADPMFAALISLPEIDWERVVSHVFVTGAFAWWSAGWIRGALLGTSRRWALPEALPVRLGIAEVTTSLGALVVLFALFVGIQLQWLFGGADVVLATTGLTVAEYARRGFFELLAVAALVLPLILGTGALAREEAVARRHRMLSRGLLVLLAAIIVSALMRMRLYVENFGLSTDRLYATAVMLWLALLFGAMALTVLRGRPRAFAAFAVLSGFVTLFLLNGINPEQLVTRVNLARPAGVRAVDYAYLARLSGDAGPMVANALTAALPSPESCEGIRTLRTRWQRRQDTSWNLGSRRGRAAVDNLSAADELRLCAGAPAPPPTSP